MQELILWALATFGMTAIVVDARILDRPRQRARERWPIVGKLVTCYQCSGFWCGMLSAVVILLGGPLLLIAYASAGSGLSMVGAALLNLIENAAKRAARDT